jgi:YVTN family beta-propeller protein
MKTGRMLWRTQIAGLRADHVGLSPDGRRLFVSALTANEVQVLDAKTGSIVGSFPTGDWPHVIKFSRDGSNVYVGSLGDQLLPSGLDGRHWLTVADARSQVLRNYSFDAGVRPFVFTADGGTAFVQLSYLNGFVELNLDTGQIVKTVQLPVTGPGAQMKPTDYPNQAAHHGIDLARDGRTICDAGTISNYAALVSAQTLVVEKIIPVGDQPAEAVTSIDGRYCFVADRGPASNSVSVISYRQRREIARIPVGQHPQEEEVAAIPAGLVPPPPARERGHIRERRARRYNPGGVRAIGW